ncbi:MAG: dTDP-4-dehydrorhamnose 3,5-epimerase [Candidatus Amesbacteria bacterium GW2011_GWA2_47_11b]|uniref:dTDP-4-dehydrorhamnose 3,5-epimerase n=2 Tax=Candidatus Amesiibacteriota TaxID=1752730 RepID=A0A0G1SLG9_9BACT|nr:MAG: dTDP-4-dehydrorhamnose 3,5-epimerase [Candidatus Curtissbacteria bacterium GW2011_GWB1_40_28]KKU29403.1 MAG: dTDP-4-dehydrorhamnose 3,5-epimerase [Microgenomates group bacterium GW2011_GWC1_46_20]KKU58505.1 MAG: dTDP-4-dehydrorhamnose 3,5-epimerase [Candidatus Amesbacteria bacterium GW2011_GWA2_47_11b]KKU70344.1 MAG: dTDP-4-dehydrorhamnose 3,5-epimerase [Candidatus Amesbacteria bacterium GW2011_GWA1_47_20]HCH59283.1 dTDP-4-dehydrorhamnose 3,5-epimerase [Candidatus Zambryskibacteria bact
MTANQFVKPTSLPGLFVLERPTFTDNRGFFREVFHLNELEDVLGYSFHPVQWNHSRSLPNVIRALHAENWNKLVYPVSGEIFIAIVDIRPDSSTFKKSETFIINDTNRNALFISKGLANSICVIGNTPVDYIYLVDAYYDGKDTRAVAWNDPDLAIPWPIKNPTISDRDRTNPRLRDLSTASKEV